MRYFLDTSALLPRYLARVPGHLWVKQLCARTSGHSIAIAEITEAELASALNQLLRGGVIRKHTCDNALALFWNQITAQEYRTLAITSDIIRRAADLCGTYSLKGYDAVQLACGLTWREDARQADSLLASTYQALIGDPVFVTEDTRLSNAALGEGFVVDSPVHH